MDKKRKLLEEASYYDLIVAQSVSVSIKRSRALLIVGTMISTCSITFVCIHSACSVAIRAFPTAAVVCVSSSKNSFSFSSDEVALWKVIQICVSSCAAVHLWSPVKTTSVYQRSISEWRRSIAPSTILPWTASVPFRSSTMVLMVRVSPCGIGKCIMMICYV